MSEEIKPLVKPNEPEIDKVEHMEFEYKDEKTGKIKRYEVSYSQILQEKIAKALKLSNYLKVGMIITLVLLLILGYLVFIESGIVGYYLRRMVCPGMI